MRYRLLAEVMGRRTFVAVFETGDEVMAGLEAFAREQRLAGSHFTAIGACSQATLGYFDWETKEYRPIPIAEQVEVLSLVGDISLAPEGGPQVHAHMVVGKSDGTAHGGHLLRATVRPTLEVMVVEEPAHLRRQFDPASGIALIRV
jgi:predicted DNA-binding protein with PD1-like motif